MQLTTTHYSRIFLHFFDLHFLAAKGIDDRARAIKANVEAECRRATRFAILAADEVLLPASSFFESDLCFKVLDEMQVVYEFGLLRLVGSGSSVSEFSEEKLRQYGKSSLQYRRYSKLLKRLSLHPPFLSRKGSSTVDISKGWVKVIEYNGLERLTA